MPPLFETNLSSMMASPAGAVGTPLIKPSLPRAQPTQVTQVKSGVLVVEAQGTNQIVIPRQKCYLSVFKDRRCKVHYAVVMPFRALFTRAEPLCIIDLRNSSLVRSDGTQLQIRVNDSQHQSITFTMTICHELDRFCGLSSTASTIDSWIEALSNSQDAAKSRPRRSQLEPVSISLPKTKPSKQSLSLNCIDESLEETESEVEEEEPIVSTQKDNKSKSNRSPKPLSRRSSLEIIYESSEEEDF